ncbi:MAG: enoyl-ACP reductase [Desulfurivibrionaceae bacterium]
MRKTLVVSGGTRGIGRAIVEKFAQNGINIAFTYNTNVQIAEDMMANLSERYGVKLQAYHLDILEPDSYKNLFKEIDKDFERIDYFISNAIISGRSVAGGFSSFMRLKTTGLMNIYTATVLSFVIGAQEAAKRMEKIGGGAIISLSSTGNLFYTPNYTGHGNSKAAVETIVKYAAHELGEKGIRVNAVSGGPIDTDSFQKFPNYEKVKEEIIKRSPLSRMGVPDDLSGLCYFLTTENASWITGQTFIVDGGITFA